MHGIQLNPGYPANTEFFYVFNLCLLALKLRLLGDGVLKFEIVRAKGILFVGTFLPLDCKLRTIVDQRKLRILQIDETSKFLLLVEGPLRLGLVLRDPSGFVELG